MKKQTINASDIFAELIQKQQEMTTAYNAFANVCSGVTVRDTVLDLLNQEHQIQTELFDQLKNRGWSLTAADKQAILHTKRKYENQPL